MNPKERFWFSTRGIIHILSIQSTTYFSCLQCEVISLDNLYCMEQHDIQFLVCTKVNLFSSLDIPSVSKFKGVRVYLSSILAIFLEDNKCICYVNVWKKVLHLQPTFFNGLNCGHSKIYC